MAHIHDVAPQVSTNYFYTSGVKKSDQLEFPNTEIFTGFNTPCRIEASVQNLEVTGAISRKINGTFYRIQPDHRYPPIYEDDIHFNGDGSVTAIRIKDGHADFKQRYVQTERFVHESRERRALFGRYRYAQSTTLLPVLVDRF